jgi:hypothetical protein
MRQGRWSNERRLLQVSGVGPLDHVYLLLAHRNFLAESPKSSFVTGAVVAVKFLVFFFRSRELEPNLEILGSKRSVAVASCSNTRKYCLCVHVKENRVKHKTASDEI